MGLVRDTPFSRVITSIKLYKNMTMTCEVKARTRSDGKTCTLSIYLSLDIADLSLSLECYRQVSARRNVSNKVKV